MWAGYDKRLCMIFIYDDAKHNQYSLFRTLQDGDYPWRICDAADIINGLLSPLDTLIMPGGADLYNCEKLNGAGNQRIRQFVMDGGTYIGICAGAYYGAKMLNWDHGTIAGDRELAFYDGLAKGPVTAFIEDGDINKSWRKTVSLAWADGTVTQAHYQGGPVFTPHPACDAHVMARYADLPDQPAAIVKCHQGHGIAVLSSPHIEVTQTTAMQEIYQLNTPSYKRDLHEISKLCKKSELLTIMNEVQS